MHTQNLEGKSNFGFEIQNPPSRLNELQTILYTVNYISSLRILLYITFRKRKKTTTKNTVIKTL